MRGLLPPQTPFPPSITPLHPPLTNTCLLACLPSLAPAGFGDTAASVAGSLLGRHPICLGSKKTIEGTAAGVAATLGAWWLLAAALPSRGGGDGLQIDSWGQLAVASALSCLLEAVTTQLDNVFMPLHYFALLCLL